MKRTTITSSSPVASCTFETCTQSARENGWCAQHDYAARLLSTVQRYGCPEHVEGALIVRCGFMNWLVYCERVTQQHAREIEAVLKARYGEIFEKKGKVA